MPKRNIVALLFLCIALAGPGRAGELTADQRERVGRLQIRVMRVLEQGNPAYHVPMTGALKDGELYFVACGGPAPGPAPSNAQTKPAPQETLVRKARIDR